MINLPFFRHKETDEKEQASSDLDRVKRELTDKQIILERLILQMKKARENG